MTRQAETLRFFGDLLPIFWNAMEEMGNIEKKCIEASALLTKVLRKSGFPKARLLTVGDRLLTNSVKGGSI